MLVGYVIAGPGPWCSHLHVLLCIASNVNSAIKFLGVGDGLCIAASNKLKLPIPVVHAVVILHESLIGVPGMTARLFGNL